MNINCTSLIYWKETEQNEQNRDDISACYTKTTTSTLNTGKTRVITVKTKR